MIKNILKFKCKHIIELGENYSTDDRVKITESNNFCPDCAKLIIGTRQNVTRYGKMPESGFSYNHADNKSEIGISCYLTHQKARCDYTGRKAYKLNAIIVGYGSDNEALIDASTAIKGWLTTFL